MMPEDTGRMRVFFCPARGEREELRAKLAVAGLPVSSAVPCQTVCAT